MIAGRYSLEREIGRGGTGVVWLGRDDVLGRQVALKRIGLLPGADTTDIARAEREARLGASLNHPHVVAVFDVVVEADARWLVMEYVEGRTLDQLVREGGPLRPEEAAPLLRQVADALVAAHAAGIAHRDVKPSNMLVNARQQVKLTDFGIARIATDPSLTQTGMVTGSPAYLAPEIATGGRSDGAADVWSLGATAFHLLAGHPPYQVGENVLGALYRIVHEDPPRLDGAGFMAPLMAGTLVKDPARRWSMEQVRDFLADPQHRVPSGVPSANDTDELEEVDDSGTRMLTAVTPTPARPAEKPPPEPAPEQPAAERVPPPIKPPGPVATTGAAPRRSRSKGLLAGLAVAAVLVLGLIGWAVLAGRGDTSTGTAAPTSPSPSPSATPSASPSKKPAAKPTAVGMEAFIRDYVTTVGADPDEAWKMLTPKFQRESGGIQQYRDFWGPATNGEVRSIEANPDDLTVSYQVHFDNFDNGPGPTVLDLEFKDGQYRIDGENTKGFVPAG